MSIKTKGTRLYVLDPRNDQITVIDCPKGITGLGLSTPQLDETCLESEAQEFGPGMPAPGTVSVTLDFDTAKASHMLLVDLVRNQVTAKWAIGFSDGTAAPTVDTAGDFELADTRSWITFSAYVADLPFDFALNANINSTVSLQMSGIYEVIPKAAS